MGKVKRKPTKSPSIAFQSDVGPSMQCLLIGSCVKHIEIKCNGKLEHGAHISSDNEDVKERG